MKNFKEKIVSILLATLMVGSITAMTVYADPDNVGGDQTVLDDVPQGDGGGQVDEPQYDPVVTDEPQYDPVVTDEPQYDPVVTDEPQYDDSGNTGSGDEPYQDTESPAINYDANYYYNSGYIGDSVDGDTGIVTYNTAFNDSQLAANYNNGMTFDEFERATDYDSSSVATEVVDMYNSNGSSSKGTLSEKDWQDISLNLGKVSSDGTGDFSFIKDNNSDIDSNFSVLFMIFGVAFIVGALGIITYMIISAVRSRKLYNQMMLANASDMVEKFEPISKPDNMMPIDVKLVDDTEVEEPEETFEDITADGIVAQVLSNVWQETESKAKETRRIRLDNNLFDEDFETQDIN